MRYTLTGLIALGLLALPLGAQPQMAKPGPEHAFLKESEGTWDAVAKSPMGDSKGVLHCKMGLNGLWLDEHYIGEGFEGKGHTTYDSYSKKFVNVWIDSMVTRPMVSEGSYDKDKKTMTLHGFMPPMEGEKGMASTITITYKDANTKVLTLKGKKLDAKTDEPSEFQMVEITYKRRVK
jgi:hypothetical protein